MSLSDKIQTVRWGRHTLPKWPAGVIIDWDHEWTVKSARPCLRALSKVLDGEPGVNWDHHYDMILHRSTVRFSDRDDATMFMLRYG